MDDSRSASHGRPQADAGGARTAGLWGAVAVLMFGLAVALPVFGRQLYHRYHTYRADKIAAEATDLLKEERWEAASQVLKEDFKTYGKDPPILRALSSLFLDGYDDPLMGANLLRQVMANGAATADDVRKLAHATLQLGDTPEARRLYETLPAIEKCGRPGLELLSEIQRQSGQPALADNTLRAALTLDPEDARSQFRLALLEEAGTFEVSKTVAAQAVWNVARRNDSLALDAIAHLCESRAVSARQSLDLLSLVEQNPRATPKDRFRVLSAVVRANPMEREKLIASEVARNQGAPTEGLFEFLRWLGIEKQYDAIIGLVNVDTALRDPDVFLVYVDALAAADRWKELLELVQRPKVPVSDATRHFICAECFAHLNSNLLEAGDHIEKVYSTAGPSDQQAILKSADLAETRGLNNLAITGYLRVAETRPNLQVGLLEKVMELQYREKNVPAILGILRRLRELRPANHSYVDRLNYLRLVTGNEIELAWDVVSGPGRSASVAADSPVIPRPLLRALAAMRMGDSGLAGEEIKALDASLRLPAGQRAVWAGIVAAAGDDVRAFRMAESIPKALLLPDELLFFERATR